MEAINLCVGWFAILGGLLAGGVIGMFFDKECSWASLPRPKPAHKTESIL